ncbi:hypothetical protein HOLleu_29691 [Holothuria leucospilota]|uniref:Uncharacterized protein n=1 Tax=Holothuria leucospilota TaxID=206669 RepID=A0A9Q1BJB5_HOLLE|nr:hypothetical protein HOLleu_29691 [Holothuria leucospilota]
MAASSGYIGRLGSFDKAREPFSSYIERMELFFLANNISSSSPSEEKAVQERKKAIFLTEIGPEIYVTLTNLLSPAKPKDESFDTIISKLKNHFDPKPLEITESCKFGTRNQKNGGTITRKAMPGHTSLPKAEGKLKGAMIPRVTDVMAHIHLRTAPSKTQSATTATRKDILLQPDSQNPDIKGKMGENHDQEKCMKLRMIQSKSQMI